MKYNDLNSDEKFDVLEKYIWWRTELIASESKKWLYPYTWWLSIEEFYEDIDKYVNQRPYSSSCYDREFVFRDSVLQLECKVFAKVFYQAYRGTAYNHKVELSVKPLKKVVSESILKKEIGAHILMPIGEFAVKSNPIVTLPNGTRITMTQEKLSELFNQKRTEIANYERK